MLWCKMDCRGKRPEAEIPKTKKKLFKLSRLFKLLRFFSLTVVTSLEMEIKMEKSDIL